MKKTCRDTLTETAIKFNTDKNSHGYIEIYKDILPDKVKIKKLLEIGAYKGDSLMLWQEVFPKAKIHTIENFSYAGCADKETLKAYGFTVHEGNQIDIEFLASIKDEFDVIIDDGDHRPVNQQMAFRHLFANNLKKGGLYVIEDVMTSLDKGWLGDTVEKDTTLSAFRTFLSLSVWDSKCFPDHELAFWKNVIERIEIFDDKLIAIWKK